MVGDGNVVKRMQGSVERTVMPDVGGNYPLELTNARENTRESRESHEQIGCGGRWKDR